MEKQILEKYFIEKKSQKEIAEELKISKSKVSRIVSKDIRYQNEKEDRKNKNKIKNRIFTINYMNKKRKQAGIDIEYAILRQLHDQASRELSGGKKQMGNRAFRDWNASAYEYNPRNQSYVLKKEIKAGADVPKTINWKSF